MNEGRKEGRNLNIRFSSKYITAFCNDTKKKERKKIQIVRKKGRKGEININCVMHIYDKQLKSHLLRNQERLETESLYIALRT